jgi:diguanylate cyclase (GGDEF)-like protein
VRSGSGATTHYILVLHDVTDERRTRQELEHRAYHDPLTGLANRHLLKDRFEQALARAHRHNTSFAVVLLDMNGFKLINDRFGHDMGDELLKCVGARLRDCVRQEDTVARIGGDEFVLLLESNSSESPEAVVQRAAEAARQPILLKGRRIRPAFCTGVARYGVDGFDVETLLKAADVGLYRSKARTRRPSVSMFTAAFARGL